MVDDTGRSRFHLLYSIFLLVVIPSVLIINTVWWVRQSKDDNNRELEEKALLLSTALATDIMQNSKQPEGIRVRFETVKSEQSDVLEISLYELSGGYLIPVTSTRPDRLTNRLSDLSTIPAWQLKKTTFEFGGEYQGNTLERVGVVQKPILDGQNNPVGLLHVTLSFATNDQRLERTFQLSVLFLFAAVVLIVLLLTNHFRMIESTVLLQKLKEIDRMKDDFISMASHELRTPLTAILGFASMLLEGSGGKLTDKGKHYVDVIMHSSHGLQSLVGDMLDVSRIEQGRISFEMKEVDLGEAVQSVIYQMQIPASNKGLLLSYEKPANPLILTLDPVRMHQVLFNLIGNAVKYTEKGTVTVTLRQQRGVVILTVADTGIGMSPEDQKKLFAKFYRIRNEKTVQIVGTGLGLWITKQLIERMGGRIEVMSEEGVGSQFHVTFRN